MKQEFNKKSKKLGKIIKLVACTALITGISLSSAFSSKAYAKSACEKKYVLASDIAFCQVKESKKKKKVIKRETQSEKISNVLSRALLYIVLGGGGCGIALAGAHILFREDNESNKLNSPSVPKNSFR